MAPTADKLSQIPSVKNKLDMHAELTKVISPRQVRAASNAGSQVVSNVSRPRASEKSSRAMSQHSSAAAAAHAQIT